MLKALKNQLSLLAVENGSTFAGKVKKYSRLKKNAQWSISKSLSLIIMMPDLMAKMRDAVYDSHIPAPVQKLYQFALSYMYDPYDFIPDKSNGLFGYLDDAYFIGRIYERTSLLLNLKDNAQEIAKDIPQTLDVVKTVIPEEAKIIDQMIDELAQGKRDLYNKLIQQRLQNQRKEKLS